MYQYCVDMKLGKGEAMRQVINPLLKAIGTDEDGLKTMARLRTVDKGLRDAIDAEIRPTKGKMDGDIQLCAPTPPGMHPLKHRYNQKLEMRRIFDNDEADPLGELKAFFMMRPNSQHPGILYNNANAAAEEYSYEHYYDNHPGFAEAHEMLPDIPGDRYRVFERDKIERFDRDERDKEMDFNKIMREREKVSREHVMDRVGERQGYGFDWSVFVGQPKNPLERKFYEIPGASGDTWQRVDGRPWYGNPLADDIERAYDKRMAKEIEQMAPIPPLQPQRCIAPGCNDFSHTTRPVCHEHRHYRGSTQLPKSTQKRCMGKMHCQHAGCKIRPRQGHFCFKHRKSINRRKNNA